MKRVQFHYILCYLFWIILLSVLLCPAISQETDKPSYSKNEDQPLHIFGGLADHITAVCFSPNGKHLILAEASENVLKIVSTSDWHTERMVILDQIPWAINISPDGKSLAVAGSHGLTVWDTNSWRLKQHFIKSIDPIFSGNLVFFPDGRMLIVEQHSSVLISGGKQKMVIGSNHWGDIIGLALSPNGKELALGGLGWLKVLNTKTWQPIQYYRNLWKDEYQDNDWVREIAFSSDGHLLAAGSVNCLNAIVWKTADWHKAYTLHQETGFSDIQFSRSPSYLLTVGIQSSSTHTHLNLWAISNGKSIGSVNDHFREFGIPIDAFLSPDDSMIVTETEGNCVVIWKTHIL